MNPTAPERRALGASAVLLVLALACIAMFIPPLNEATTASPLRAVGTALVLTAALLLHWVFLGIAVRRMRRSLAGWLALAVLLFPVGSAMALILLSWFEDQAPPELASARYPPGGPSASGPA